jgi:hypothetical protein
MLCACVRTHMSFFYITTYKAKGIVNIDVRKTLHSYP